MEDNETYYNTMFNIMQNNNIIMNKISYHKYYNANNNVVINSYEHIESKTYSPFVIMIYSNH